MSVPADPHDLQRFVSAQRGIYELALAELRQGRKTSHWMWFVFPQIAGLGRSAMSVRYAISSAGEAAAYWRHDVLGPRLKACIEALISHRNLSARQIMGSPDDLKLRSSLTLFAHPARTSRCSPKRFGASSTAGPTRRPWRVFNSRRR